MTDLEKFVTLYKSFGIECQVEKDHRGFYIYMDSSHEKGTTPISGPERVSCTIEFDENGKFIDQKLDCSIYCE